MIHWIVIYPVDNVIDRINHYPAEKYWGNQLRDPLDSDLSGGSCYTSDKSPFSGEVLGKPIA